MTINIFYSLIAGCYSTGSPITWLATTAWRQLHPKVNSVSTFLPQATAFLFFGTPCGSPNALALHFRCTTKSGVNAALQTCWPAYRPKDRPTDLLTDLQTCWLTDRLPSWPARLMDRPADWPTDLLTDRPICLLTSRSFSTSLFWPRTSYISYPAESGWLTGVGTPGCSQILDNSGPCRDARFVLFLGDLDRNQTCVLLTCQLLCLPWDRHPGMPYWSHFWAATFSHTRITCGRSLSRFGS